MKQSGFSSRVLVVGCGAIGGVVAYHLADLGHPVSVVTTNAKIAAALRRDGLRVGGQTAPLGKGAVLERLDDSSARFQVILLATQPPQVEEAARQLLPWLEPDGLVVCFQNGLCEERVGAIVGPERVVGAVVAWGASMLGPGVYERTSEGGFALGSLTPRAASDLDELVCMLEGVGPVTVTHNLLGVRWSKLAINCAISTLGTIGGDALGALLRKRFVRRLGLEIMTEVVGVAKAEGVRLEKVIGTLDLERIALSPGERIAGGTPSLVAKHSLLLAVGARYRRLRSSMLRAIERGRSPAVAFLNGEVVERAQRRGMVVPVNERATQLVWEIAAGRAQPSLELLRGLYANTR